MTTAVVMTEQERALIVALAAYAMHRGFCLPSALATSARWLDLILGDLGEAPEE